MTAHTESQSQTNQAKGDSQLFEPGFVKQLGIVLGLSTAVYLLRGYLLQGFTRAESAFAEGAREMIANHEMLAPVYQKIPYFDKPPLFYWLTVGTFEVFGINMLSSRVISIIAAILTTIVTALFARHHFGKKTAIISAMVLSTAMCYYEFASTCMPDMWLTLLELVVGIAFYQRFFGSSQKHLAWSCVAALFAGLGWMIKGPVVLLFPGVAIVLQMVISRRMPRLTFKEIAIGSAIFWAVVLPWHVAIYRIYGFESLNWLYLKGMFGRFLGKHELYNFGHGFSYMFVQLLSGFLPWTPFMVAAYFWLIKKLVKDKSLDSSVADTGNAGARASVISYLLIWSTFTVVFFALSSSNWGYYNLPIYPALAVVTAFAFNHLGQVRFKKAELAAWLVFALTLAGTAVWSATALPNRARKEEFLSLAQDLQKLPASVQFYCHNDLIGQYFLIDHVTFQSNRIPDYCDQAQLVERLKQPAPAYFLMPEPDLIQLEPEVRAKLKVLKSVKFDFVKFPNCKLVPLGNGVLVQVVLVSKD